MRLFHPYPVGSVYCEAVKVERILLRFENESVSLRELKDDQRTYRLWPIVLESGAFLTSVPSISRTSSLNVRSILRS